MAENESTNPSPAAAGVPPPIAERMATITGSEAYNRADHPDHAASGNVARLLYEQEDREERGQPEPERQPEDKFLDANDASLEPLPHIDVLREQAGVDAPVLPEQIRENWVESAEADFLSACIDEGLSKSQVEAMLTRYTDELVIGGRQWSGERPGDAEAWMDFLKSINVPDAFARRLIAWARANTQGE